MLIPKEINIVSRVTNKNTKIAHKKLGLCVNKTWRGADLNKKDERVYETFCNCNTNITDRAGQVGQDILYLAAFAPEAALSVPGDNRRSAPNPRKYF